MDPAGLGLVEFKGFKKGVPEHCYKPLRSSQLPTTSKSAFLVVVQKLVDQYKAGDKDRGNKKKSDPVLLQDKLDQPHILTQKDTVENYEGNVCSTLSSHIRNVSVIKNIGFLRAP